MNVMVLTGNVETSYLETRTEGNFGLIQRVCGGSVEAAYTGRGVTAWVNECCFEEDSISEDVI